MAKQGQHKNDSFDQRVSKGPDNPSKSLVITTGTPKKQETYRKQAIEREDPAKQPQAAKNEWNEDTRDKPSLEGSTRASRPRSGRSGSDSDSKSSTRGH